MGAFTEWFYRTRHEPLYDRFTGPVSVGYIGQHLIAMRANAAAYVNLSRQESDFFRNNISGATKWNMLRNAIRNSGGPVPLLLVANNRYVYCLAFSFVGNDVFCYDMQNPGVTFEATYSEATEDFVGYGAEKFTFFGSGSMAYREPFENILRDAEAGFHNSPDAVFDLGGVADGDIILHPNLHIEGQVHSGSHLIRRVEVTGDTLPQRVVVDVPLGGALTLDLPLLNGDNHFLFRALAYTPKGGWLEVNSNLSNKLLRIKGDFVQTGPVFKFEIEALPAQDEFSTEGTFELFAKVLHNGEFVYFRSSSPSTLPSGTGMIDANTFVVLSPDTPVLSPYFRVRRTDPQPEPKQAYFRYRIHNPNHPDPQWHVLENQQVLTATALDDDPHWEDPGFYHGWSSIWGPLTWWHEW